MQCLNIVSVRKMCIRDSFKVVDSDDSLAPEAYKQVLDFLRRIVKKNHELDMLISNFVYDRHDENGDVLRQKSIDYLSLIHI